MSVEHLLNRWKNDPTVNDNIVTWEITPSHKAEFTPFPNDLDPIVALALKNNGYQELYSHQAEAWEIIKNRKHVVVVTGTASGKTLCYNLPVLDGLKKNPLSTALYIFPTKALAQDQYNELQALLVDGSDNLGKIHFGVYDGDTPANARRLIRKKARLIITNPDMLHTGILPHHTNWEAFFRGLQFIVIDETHTYRGVFGSHVANVIRRLKRITKFYGASPIFVLTSATIANPVELAQNLVEEDVCLINHDGAWRGSKHFLIYNPPIVNEELGIRKSLLQESVRLTDDLFSAGIQTVVFGRTRRSIELALTFLRQDARRNRGQSEIENQVRGYRSGYLPSQRREIENGLRQGVVRIVVATNALELGIDIGDLDAAILAGYPGTIASTWQQAGRSGRGDKPSLAVLVASAAPLDQYLARFPDYFFSSSPEHALINPNNILILLGHLRCAAFELPFNVGDPFGNVAPGQVRELLSYLDDEGVLHFSKNKYFWMSDSYPAQAVSLRNASPENVLLQVNEDQYSSVIGEIDQESSLWMVHPGAVYLHEGQMYQVDDLDLEKHTASLAVFNGDYYTEPQRETKVDVIEILLESSTQRVEKFYGELKVTNQVIGFKKLRWYTAEMLGYGEVNLPPHELYTTGYWFGLSEATIETLQTSGLWNSAPNDYGPGWKLIRDKVRARDGYRCQVCGLSEQNRSHDVHHKVPLRAFNNSIEANQLQNLITLCQACHRKAETSVKIRSGLSGLGYVLGNLAPFFLMCDPGDLGVHTDPQSTLASHQDKPIPSIVFYDQIPAGIGLSERLYEIHLNLIQSAKQLVMTCPCTSDGCPSCVGPGGENGSGSKEETLAILEILEE